MPEGRPRPALIGLLVAAGVALLALLFVLFVPLGGGERTTDSLTVPGHPLVGKAAPEIELTTIDGEPVLLSELRGRPVLVNFWATWCPPCREEFPLMVTAYAEHADEGLQILGVLHDDFATGAREFAADMGATWPVLDDAQDTAYGDYLVAGLPSSFFIDRDGIVRDVSLGGFTEEGLTAQLARILPEAPASDA